MNIFDKFEMTDEERIELKERYHRDFGHEIEKISRFINRWYFNQYPSIGTYSFHKFVASSTGTLLKYIVDEDAMEALRIHVTGGVPTAFTDLENIYLPACAFDKDWYTYNFFIADDSTITTIALAVINLFLVHEALHIAETEVEIPKIIQGYKSLGKLQPEDDDALFAKIINLVEDFYIEHFCSIKYKPEYNFIVCGNKIAFNEIMVSICFEMFDQEPSIDHFLNLIASYKCTDYIDDDRFDFISQYIEKFDSARNITLNQDQRVELAFEIYEMLRQDSEVSESEGQESEEGEEGEGEEGEGEGNATGSEGENDKSGQQKGRPSLDNSGFDEYSSAQRNYDNESDSNDVDGAFDNDNLSEEKQKQYAKVEQTFRDAVQEVIDEQRIHDMRLNQKIEGQEVDEVSVEYYDVASHHRYDNRPESEYIFTDSRFLKLGMVLKHARSEKSKKGVAKNRGSKINKTGLHRIATDSKILYRNDFTTMDTGIPEVMLLIDISGSTMSWSDRNSLCAKQLSAAMGAFKSLQMCGIPTSVYTHTTDYDGVSVAGIAAFNMPLNGGSQITTGDIENRFNTAYVLSHAGNGDGVALEFVATRFTKRPGTKIVIIFSDGRPVLCPNIEIGNNYCDAVEHTRMIADELRRNNIDILSMSLDEDVIEANDFIYGKKFNFAAVGDNLNNVLLKLVRVIGMA
jgi:hypothetical protein